MTVHTLHPAQTRCDHGHFTKPGAPCRRCTTTAAAQGATKTAPTTLKTPRRLSLVKTPTIPVLSVVRPIPPTTDTTADKASTPDAEAAAQPAPALPARTVHVSLPVTAIGKARVLLQVTEIAACRAALNARKVGLDVRVMDWRGNRDGTATADLGDGIVIRYQPRARSMFAVSVPCLLGAHHYHSIAGAAALYAARIEADNCLEPHADFTDWPTAAARDLSAAFAPRPVPAVSLVRPLQEKDTTPDA